MAYKAMDVAKYIVEICILDDKPISNLQLQKILYYLQFDYFKENNRPLMEDDFEAWQFGPVIGKVYYYFCSNGGNPITFLISPIEDGMIEEKDKIFIERKVRELRKMNPWDMVEQTHKPGKAWDIVYDKGKGNQCVIDKSLIFEKGL